MFLSEIYYWCDFFQIWYSGLDARTYHGHTDIHFINNHFLGVSWVQKRGRI